ncbi:MAG TPA: hypothetical protein VF021_00655 [Longimicrobiales bacterium]
MSQAIVFTLMFFAAIGFSGAGAAFAVARARELDEAESDLGMRAVTLLLFLFGASCGYVAAGLSGLCSFGLTVSWFSYVVAAQRIGVFRIEQPRMYAEPAAERRRIA